MLPRAASVKVVYRHEESASRLLTGASGRPLLWAASPLVYLVAWPPLRLARMCREHESVRVVRPPRLLRRPRSSRKEGRRSRCGSSGWMSIATSVRSRSRMVARRLWLVGWRRGRRSDRVHCTLRRTMFNTVSRSESVGVGERLLHQVISAVGSSLNLEEVLAGVVDLLSEGSAVHACFVYLLERDQTRLVLRAASEPYTLLVGRIELVRGEGLAWWALDHREPAFIRENALDDPRVKYVPELEEERFQSLVAIPVFGGGSSA